MENKSDEKEFLTIIEDILINEKFLELKNFKHHYYTTRYQHCLNVAYTSYILSKHIKLKNTKEIVRGAILHDFFFYDWRNTKHYNEYGMLKGSHPFYHPFDSLKNCQKYFILNDMEKNIILSHMFPCCLNLPKYKECYIIIFTDKLCSIAEGIFKYNYYKISST